MVDELINRLNLLCRKYIFNELNFTESDEIRKVFKEIKNLGFEIFTTISDPTKIVTDYLSEDGKIKYMKMMEFRQNKLAQVDKQEFEAAADFRDIERQLQREVLFDYMKHEGVAYFKISNRKLKIIECRLYCEVLKEFFKIE